MAGEALCIAGQTETEFSEKKKPQLFLDDRVLEELMLVKTLTSAGSPQESCKALSASDCFIGTPAPLGPGGEDNSTQDQWTPSSSTPSIDHEGFVRVKSASFPSERTRPIRFSQRAAVATRLPSSPLVHPKGSRILRRLSVAL
jgi:hypothetical protein